MESKAFTYDGLSKKHGAFSTPDCEISIGGKDLEKQGMLITQLEVDLTVGYEAGGCVFTVGNGFDPKTSVFTSGWLDSILVPGKSAEIKLGYSDSRVTVFYGYVNSVTCQFDSEEGVEIFVSCLDAKGAMMAGASQMFWGEKKMDQVVKGIFDKYGSLGNTTKIDTIPANYLEKQNFFSNCQTDYEYLVSIARRINFEFFVSRKEIRFVKRRSITASAITLKWGESLISFSREVSLAGQLKDVSVIGLNELEGKNIIGKATDVTKTGTKASSAVWDKINKWNEKIYDSSVKSEKEAKALAGSILEERLMDFVSGNGECMGMPELEPGRFLKIEGCGAANGSYYIKKVRHVLDESGFTTKFEFGGNSI
jgi:hypothetical protein